MEKEKFYKKTWFAIVMTIFVYPVGMYFIWTSKKLGKVGKIVASVLGGIFFLSIMISDTSEPEITLSGESSIVVTKGTAMTSDELVNSAVASITDNRTEMTTSDITVTGFEDIDFDTEGKYKVSFTAIDDAENEATVPFTVNVELSEEQKAEIEAAEKEAAEKEAAEKEAAEKEAAEADKANRENEKALKSAESYIKIMAFSEEGLRGQLKFEGFTAEQIDYALDNLEVDWNEEAVQSATSYSNTLSMSSSAIYDQLLFEGFTAEQAQYGIDNY
ncbi:Ltp family lipoprotein [Mollicutes bacterium LVI A0078]|nr:Ltp family lipoprotein [Mollicutes bacterium LVI A0075]WOO90226.1 Ltp family lipoprotein [Mollicutes bacterium LVI A0078]